MCCMRLAENTGLKKLPSAHHLTTSGYIFATKACIDNQKKTCLTAIPPPYPIDMSPQYGELRPTNGWDRFGSLGHFSKFQLVSLLAFYCSDITHWRPTKLCTMLDRLLGWYTIYIHFWGLLPLTEFRRLQKSLYVQVLRSPILTALLHTLQQRVSVKLCGVGQGMELRNFCRGCHLYSAGRPSRSASAHVLVVPTLLYLMMTATLHRRKIQTETLQYRRSV